MKKILLFLSMVFCLQFMYASDEDSITTEDMEEITRNDSIMQSFHYKTGRVIIGKNLPTVDVPPGCLFLESAEARLLMEDIFGNMPNPDCMGVLLSDTPNMFTGCTWLVDFNYNSDRHVNDA